MGCFVTNFVISRHVAETHSNSSCEDGSALTPGGALQTLLQLIGKGGNEPLLELVLLSLDLVKRPGANFKK